MALTESQQQQPLPEPATETSSSNGNGIKSPEPPQRPRKLSFDETDMELTRLKLGAAVRRFPLSWVVVASTLCVTAGLLVRYLLPFNSESYKTALSTLGQWRQLIAERATVTLAASHEQFESLRTTVAGSSLVDQFRNPSQVVFASLLGLGVTWFTYFVVYLDSSIPGVNPPTPFSASKKKRFSDKERRFHLGYITALLSGLTVFLIVLFVE